MTLGKQRTGIMRATKEQATVPQAIEYLPRFHGPGRKRSPTKRMRMAIGIVKDLETHQSVSNKPSSLCIRKKNISDKTHVNAAIPPIENSAPTARLPPKISVKRKIPITAFPHTALTGVLVYGLTTFQMLLPGKTPSRAYANVTLLAASMQPCPILNPAITVSARIHSAIFCVMHCIRYAAKG